MSDNYKTYYRKKPEFGDEFFIEDSHLYDERQAWIYIQGPVSEDEVVRIRDALNEFLADKSAGVELVGST